METGDSHMKLERQLVRQCLMTIGLWPTNTRRTTAKFVATLLFTFNGFSSITGLIHTDDDQFFAIFYFTLFLHAAAIFVSFKARTNLIKQLFNVMKSDCLNYRYLRSNDKKLMMKYGKYVKWACAALFTFMSIATLGSFVSPVLTKLITGESIKPMWRFWCKLEGHQVMIFLIIYLLQFGSLTTITLMTMTTYSYSLLIVMNALAQFDILLNDIGTYMEKCKSSKRTVVGEITERCEALKDIIERHIALINYVKLCDKLVSPVILYQFFNYVISFCMCGSRIIEAFHGGDVFYAIRCALYMTVFMPAFYLIFWLGERLIEKSTKVGDTVFEIEWYNCTVDEVRSLMMIMAQSRRPVTLTAGGYITMSLESYKNWITNAASYLSVLIAIKSR